MARAVCLELERRGRALPVAFDPWRGDWRVLGPEERNTLDTPCHGGPRHRIRPREVIRGAASRVLPALDASRQVPEGRYGGLLVVEKLESRRAEELARLRPRLAGPSVAVVHDLIPVKFPQFATRRSLREFGGYLDTLRHYDGVAAVSEASQRDLIDYWTARGVRKRPPVTVITPATDPVVSAPGSWSGGDGPPVVLMVATLEPRKNQLTVLEACEVLWRHGTRFALRLIGRRRSGGDEAAARVAGLRAKGRPVEWLGHVSDESPCGRLRRVPVHPLPVALRRLRASRGRESSPVAPLHRERAGRAPGGVGRRRLHRAAGARGGPALRRHSPPARGRGLLPESGRGVRASAVPGLERLRRRSRDVAAIAVARRRLTHGLSGGATASPAILRDGQSRSPVEPMSVQPASTSAHGTSPSIPGTRSATDEASSDATTT